ncbi:MAG: preprotein translocase subunit SecA [Dehalococcoidia bacterium]|nr:preprotein translocase subunit SecA [Dehalococcoidia bacterium]
MLKSLPKLFGDPNARELQKLNPLVAKINSYEPVFEKLVGAQLQEKTQQFRARLAKGEALDDLLPEAFALVREAGKRTLGQRHYDEQLLGGIILHQGKVAEMRTGEGKTLVATLPVYLNALTGLGVHVVTVNDYLAKRDAAWMGKIYYLLGVSVGILNHDTSFLYDPSVEIQDERMKDVRPVTRRQAYGADITYGTNTEFGFDYLRDNMVMELAQAVQRPLHYAIVDEVDNILIDEARTPLIISGQSSESAQTYRQCSQLIPTLHETEDYTADAKDRTVTLTPAGLEKLERRLGVENLYDQANYKLTHYVDNALKAHAMYRRDREYVVTDGEVIIVDEFTGRLMPGRRYSDGLHQAIEAKEGVNVRPETMTLATITIQNYFRLYKKLAGMTGTAATEAEELFKIYKVDVLVVPTHMEMIRRDENDLVYKSEKGKWEAIAAEIEALHKKRQPALVGTVSIESSELLSGLLTRRGVPHEVLNAKQHEREAQIVAQAGRLGSVTVATNMAGRGTDIVLGGVKDNRDPADWQREHDEVVELGGLRITGTERHEARRIDNQLRGRAARQGDPGSSRFFVSVEDDLMKRFGGDMIKRVMNFAGLPDDQPIEMGLISKSIENAQTRVEGHNFDIRKHLLDYDDVVNKHREVIYTERRKTLEGANIRDQILELVHKELAQLVSTHLRSDDSERWDLDGLMDALKLLFSIPASLTKEAIAALSVEEAGEALNDYVDQLYAEREQQFGEQDMRILERMVMLRTIDVHWIEHLTAMDNMRQGVGLQGIGQRDPLVVYKQQGHQAFQELSERIRHDLARTIFNVAIQRGAPQAETQTSTQGTPRRAVPPAIAPAKEQKAMLAAISGHGQDTARAGADKVGRNDPCPCGSGKKYKKCHGT